MTTVQQTTVQVAKQVPWDQGHQDKAYYDSMMKDTIYFDLAD